MITHTCRTRGRRGAPAVLIEAGARAERARRRCSTANTGAAMANSTHTASTARRRVIRALPSRRRAEPSPPSRLPLELLGELEPVALQPLALHRESRELIRELSQAPRVARRG